MEALFLLLHELIQVLGGSVLAALLDGVHLLEVLGDESLHHILLHDGAGVLREEGAHDWVAGLHSEDPLRHAVEGLPVVVLVVFLELIEEAVLVEGSADDELLW